MFDITVKQNIKVECFIKPQAMFGYKEGTIFQQYFRGLPCKYFYVNCGINESLLTIWYNDESKKYCFSHEDDKSIKELVAAVKVKILPDAKLNVVLEENCQN